MGVSNMASMAGWAPGVAEGEGRYSWEEPVTLCVGIGVWGDYVLVLNLLLYVSVVCALPSIHTISTFSNHSRQKAATESLHPRLTTRHLMASSCSRYRFGFESAFETTCTRADRRDTMRASPSAPSGSTKNGATSGPESLSTSIRMSVLQRERGARERGRMGWGRRGRSQSHKNVIEVLKKRPEELHQERLEQRYGP